MNPESEPLRDLRTLILKSQSEPLSEEEINQLNELMQCEGGSHEAAALIDQLCALSDSGSMDSLPMTEVLSEALGCTLDDPVSLRANSVQTAPPRTAPRSTATRSSAAFWWMAIAASHVMVFSLAWSLAKSASTDRRDMQTASMAVEPPESNAVELVSGSPQLVSMTACVWRPSGDAVPTLGKPLQSGEVLKLVEGIAELRIGENTAGEAQVRIEGPASVYIRPDGQLGFLNGSMTVKSLGSGSGTVSVNTPLGSIDADGQSSLGLVASESVCECHLFSGQAWVSPYQADSAASDIQLESGEAVRLSAGPEDGISVVKFEASEASFVSARSPGFDSLEIGAKYVSAIAESQPNIYWRFEQLQGVYPQYVENEGSEPGMNATVLGEPAWRQYGDNRVAELGISTSSAFRALEPWPRKPLKEYTIEMWVKPQLYHHGEVLCLHAVEPNADGRYPHTMMLETTAKHHFTHRLTDSPANRFRFVHRALRSNEPISATSLFSQDEYQARLWQHVATQKRGNRQLIWIDGQLAAEHVNPAPLTEQVQILIGQVYPDSEYRRFVGQIDEVAIYDRCLPSLELRTHIRAAGRAIAKREPVTISAE